MILSISDLSCPYIRHGGFSRGIFYKAAGSFSLKLPVLFHFMVVLWAKTAVKFYLKDFSKISVTLYILFS